MVERARMLMARCYAIYTIRSSQRFSKMSRCPHHQAQISVTRTISCSADLFSTRARDQNVSTLKQTELGSLLERRKGKFRMWETDPGKEGEKHVQAFSSTT